MCGLDVKRLTELNVYFLVLIARLSGDVVLKIYL